MILSLYMYLDEICCSANNAFLHNLTQLKRTFYKCQTLLSCRSDPVSFSGPSSNHRAFRTKTVSSRQIGQ